jgi:D-beta-D-heptose 7-phosphate kinase / D-beta-D-heptose 1-phosphate adenosyltransferase
MTSSNTPPLPTSLAELPQLLRTRAPLVTVIGDHILDGWWAGRTERMSREAPAPVIDIVERNYAPGGAANTAMNLAALGARVRCVGLIGDDDAGARLRALLRDAGVDVRYLIPVAGCQTTTKYRVMGGDQMMVRIDEMQHTDWPAEALSAFAAAIRTARDGADADIICDYGSSTFEGPVLAALCETVPSEEGIRRPLCVVDAHDARRWEAVHPDIVTPNAAELTTLLGVPLPEGTMRADAVTAEQDRILELTGAHAAIVTLDRDGTVLLRRAAPPHRTFAHPALEKQASGAGDTFVAALTLAVASGVPLETGADLAQAAADVAVQKSGTSVCSTAELELRLGRVPDAALSLDELEGRLEAERAQGRRIVFTNGCFDVLHRGHTSYLRQARQLGDVLVVAVNGDDSVRRLKGDGRPINAALDRANVLAALSCVDYVTVFETDTPVPLIEALKPDVYAKGGDYTPEMLEEAETVRSYGGQVCIVDYVPSQSTTLVVNRIRSHEPAAWPATGQ